MALLTDHALAMTLTKFIGCLVNKFEYDNDDFMFASGPARITMSDGYPSVDVSITIINNLFRLDMHTVSDPEFDCMATLAGSVLNTMADPFYSKPRLSKGLILKDPQNWGVVKWSTLECKYK